MKFHATMMASCALALIGTSAVADCAADLAELRAEDAAAGQGISKDGSLAPLETPDAAAEGEAAVAGTGADADAGGSTEVTGEPEGADPAAAAGDAGASGDAAAEGAAGGEGIAKDGSLAPLEGTEAEPDTAVAMSGQDAQAQQQGEPTAAEAADDTAAGENGASTAGGDVAAAEGAETGAGGGAGSTDRTALLAEAQAALDAGDEAACLAALAKIDAP